jgi:hypothetical protein
MSHDIDKEQHSKRIHQKQTKIKKQVKIAKEFGMSVDKPHKFAKMHALNCGNPDCFMCSNPRKVLNERTMQERRFYQTEKIVDE